MCLLICNGRLPKRGTALRLRTPARVLVKSRHVCVAKKLPREGRRNSCERGIVVSDKVIPWDIIIENNMAEEGETKPVSI